MTVDWKKKLIPNLPYLLFVYLFDKLCQAVRLAPGLDASEKFLHLSQGFTEAFSSGLPSLHPLDLLAGIAGAVIVRLAVYAKSKNTKKYRKGIEYGSARWGTAADIAPYVDPVPDWNIPLTQTEKFCNHYPPCQKVWAAGKRVVKFIGYDAGEGYRSDKVLLGDLADRKYSKWYPLMEWGWTRDDCIRQIEAAGLPQPGKSSCFFCPSMKPDEITALREQHPDLFRRALALEDNARKNLKTVKGLGRNYSWRERFGKEFCTHGNG